MKINLNETMRTRLTNISLLVGATAFSLFLGEIILRVFNPQKMCLNVSQWDKYIGFTNIPNIEGLSKKKDFTMHVKINSKGLRDKEYRYQKPPHTFRIGAFGDSFTFGEGVQNNETYAKYLEDLFLKERNIRLCENNVEVLNFGIGKTGTSHQLALYQKEGIKYQLDMIIVGFLSGNDFNDNFGGVFYLKDNNLIHNPAAYSFIRLTQKIVLHIPFYKWAANNSHLFNLFRKTATIWDDRVRLNNGGKLNMDKSVSKDTCITNKKIQLTWKLFEQFKKETERNNIDLVVINLPTKYQASNITQEKNSHDINTKMCIDLLNILKSNNIQVVDLFPVFSGLPTSKYYFKYDGHMTKWGHQVIASNIFNYVMQKNCNYSGTLTSIFCAPHKGALEQNDM